MGWAGECTLQNHWPKLDISTGALQEQWLHNAGWWKNHSAEWDNNSCPGKDAPVYMGYSMRTPEWRYTAWMPWDVDKQEARCESEPYAVELYDQSEMSNDFNQCEIENVANQNTDLVMKLHNQMKDFFKK